MSFTDFVTRLAMMVISKEMKKRSNVSSKSRYVPPKPQKEPALPETFGGIGCLLGSLAAVVGLFSTGNILVSIVTFFVVTYSMYGVGVIIYNVKKSIQKIYTYAETSRLRKSQQKSKNTGK